ncbi:MAG TPA: hypothetical protein VL576_03360 [Candidatus Paceibacterota bacterium]|jgi:hypothetical protein|nr:hypothetical protein [Candidatus Paceibacterota bacterium]
MEKKVKQNPSDEVPNGYEEMTYLKEEGDSFPIFEPAIKNERNIQELVKFEPTH